MSEYEIDHRSFPLLRLVEAVVGVSGNRSDMLKDDILPRKCWQTSSRNHLEGDWHEWLLQGRRCKNALQLTLRPVPVLVERGKRLFREVPPDVSREGVESLQHPVHLGMLLQQVDDGCIQVLLLVFVLVLLLFLLGGCPCN